MTTVYAVATGSYSDYRIIAIYSERAKAEQLAAVEDGGEVEEYELDPAWPQWLKEGEAVWRVSERTDCRDGLLVCPMGTVDSEYYKERLNKVAHSNDYYYSGKLYVYVAARDRQHAIKIAAEKFAHHKAREAGIAL